MAATLLPGCAVRATLARTAAARRREPAAAHRLDLDDRAVRERDREAGHEPVRATATTSCDVCRAARTPDDRARPAQPERSCSTRRAPCSVRPSTISGPRGREPDGIGVRRATRRTTLDAASGRAERERRPDARGRRAAKARRRAGEQRARRARARRSRSTSAPRLHALEDRARPEPAAAAHRDRARARASVRSSSCSAVVISRAPVAPTGWPSAIAPPLGFTRAMSGFSSRSHASTTDANASLISITSRSSIVRPVRSSRRRVASIGPVSISTGSTPTRHWSTMRARGFSPSSRARCGGRQRAPRPRRR